MDDEIKFLKTQIKDLKKIIENLMKDKLTGVYNRHYLDEMLQEYERKINEKSYWFYNVYLIDLNNLHEVNRNKGYDKGDEYILENIDFIKKVLHNNNVSGAIYRIGGDEFLIITQPYDFIPVEEFKNNSFEIAYAKWDKNKSFKEIIRKLDSQIIKLKKKYNKIKLCRDCPINNYPELKKVFEKIKKNYQKEINE